MVGSQTLINIHKRLKEIKAEQSEDIPFGCVSILAVGDLLQLQTVGDSPVFASPKMQCIDYPCLCWTNTFSTLNQMRYKDNEEILFLQIF